MDQCTLQLFLFLFFVSFSVGNEVNGVAHNLIAVACFQQSGVTPVAALAALRVYYGL